VIDGTMGDQRIELGMMRLTILNGAGHEPRAASIAQLMCSHVRQLLEREMQNLGADVELAKLDVPPVQVSLDAMDDETIARAGAEAICRALLEAI
jgi:hypothetical protein